MNKIRTIIDSLSDADLQAAIRDYKSFDDTGTCPQGVLRRVVAALETEANLTPADALGVARIGLFQAGAYRWTGI